MSIGQKWGWEQRLAIAASKLETSGAISGRDGMNIGIFGGRFDPIHRGHISLATAAMQKFALGRVLFVPVNAPPHRERVEIAAFVHRYAMVALATAEEKRFVPSLLEGPEENSSEVRGQALAKGSGPAVTGHRLPAKAPR